MSNNRKIDHATLVRALLSDIGPAADEPVTETAVGGHLMAVTAGRTGLASRIHGHGSPMDDFALPSQYKRSALSLAECLLDPPGDLPQARTLGMAAVNALLRPPEDTSNLKGQDLLLDRARGKEVVVIGHFPFVERLRDEFSEFTVLELNPKPGDLPAESAGEVLPRADAVAVTSTTIINGTLGGILSLVRPEAFVLMLGPSTPFAPSLFNFGIDALSGSVVDDTPKAMEGIRAGLPYRKLTGARALTYLKK